MRTHLCPINVRTNERRKERSCRRKIAQNLVFKIILWLLRLSLQRPTEREIKFPPQTPASANFPLFIDKTSRQQNVLRWHWINSIWWWSDKLISIPSHYPTASDLFYFEHRQKDEREIIERLNEEKKKKLQIEFAMGWKRKWCQSRVKVTFGNV